MKNSFLYLVFLSKLYNKCLLQINIMSFFLVIVWMWIALFLFAWNSNKFFKISLLEKNTSSSSMTMLYISPLIQETEIGATVMPLTVHHTTKCSILLSELFCMPYFSFSAQHHGKCSYVSMHTNHLCFKIKIEKKYIKKTSELTTGLSSKLYQLLL